MRYLVVFITVLLMTTSVWAVDKTPLTLKIYNADRNSFHVNSTLIYGETEAAIIDTGFTKADALRIASHVLDSGKKLTTIFISQADPDYYFGAETLNQLFPEARIITTPAVLQAIKKKMAAKVAFWGPKMGENAPINPVLPDAYQQTAFTVDGEKVEIKGTQNLLAHRPYLWIPSIRAILGNIAIFGDLHVWTADTQTQEELAAWSAQLEEMIALRPEIVVPGHMKHGTNTNAENISYTAAYLKRFEQAKQNSKNAQALINTMQKHYPDAQLSIALDIGAKVHKGEMAW